jgi:hypothetical protein
MTAAERLTGGPSPNSNSLGSSGGSGGLGSSGGLGNSKGLGNSLGQGGAAGTAAAQFGGVPVAALNTELDAL